MPRTCWEQRREPRWGGRCDLAINQHTGLHSTLVCRFDKFHFGINLKILRQILRSLAVAWGTQRCPRLPRAPCPDNSGSDFPSKVSKGIQIHPLTTWTTAVIASWAAGEELLVPDEAGGEEDRPRVEARLAPHPCRRCGWAGSSGHGIWDKQTGSWICPPSRTD